MDLPKPPGYRGDIPRDPPDQQMVVGNQPTVQAGYVLYDLAGHRICGNPGQALQQPMQQPRGHIMTTSRQHAGQIGPPVVEMAPPTTRRRGHMAPNMLAADPSQAAPIIPPATLAYDSQRLGHVAGTQLRFGSMFDGPGAPGGGGAGGQPRGASMTGCDEHYTLDAPRSTRLPGDQALERPPTHVTQSARQAARSKRAGQLLPQQHVAYPLVAPEARDRNRRMIQLQTVVPENRPPNEAGYNSSGGVARRPTAAPPRWQPYRLQMTATLTETVNDCGITQQQQQQQLRFQSVLQQPDQVYQVFSGTVSARSKSTLFQQQEIACNQWQQQQQAVPASHPLAPPAADPSCLVHQQQQQQLALQQQHVRQQPGLVHHVAAGTSSASSQPARRQQQATMHSQWQQQQAALVLQSCYPPPADLSCFVQQQQQQLIFQQHNMQAPRAAAGAAIDEPLHAPCNPGHAASTAGPPDVSQLLPPAPNRAGMQSFVRQMIQTGDEVVVTGASDAAPATALGLMNLQVVKLLGIGGNGAVVLTKVRQLTNSSLQSLLPADAFVVLKFSTQLLWLCAQGQVPVSHLAAVTASAEALIKAELSVMQDCSTCAHTVHAYGCGSLQLANKCRHHLPVLLMEYCNLGSWGDLLFPDGRLNSSTIKQDAATVHYIVKQVLDAVMFMADIHILHRDIKPDNIMLQGLSLGCCAAGAPSAGAFANPQQAYPFVVKLGDFGCAKNKRAGMGITHQGIGTPAFQAPELGCQEQTTYTTLADVWGLVMSFLVARTGVCSPYSYMGRHFADANYAEALEMAKQRLQQLPLMYGHNLTRRELEFATGGLQGDPVFRWTPYLMWTSAYISLGPEEEGCRNDQDRR